MKQARPIRTQLLLSNFAVAAMTLVFCGTGFVLNDVRAFRESLRKELEATAKVLGNNILSSVVFVDRKEALKTLESLRATNRISGALVLDASGKVFASYGTPIEIAADRPSETLIYSMNLLQEGETIGVLKVSADKNVLRSDYLAYVAVVVGVLLPSALAALALAFLLQRRISGPIGAFTRSAKLISQTGDTSIRVAASLGSRAPLEMRDLAGAFDGMLARIDAQEKEIREANETLEKKVEERTRELRDSQQMMIHSSRLSALGEMAASIAHEINNPLAIICGLSDVLRDSASDGSLTHDRAVATSEKILSTSKRITKIIKGLRTFARDGSKDPALPTPASSLVDDVMELCRTRFKNSGVEIRLQIEDQNAVVLCRSVEIGQVLMNLVTNAFDAITALPERWIEIAVARKGQFCEFSVTDSGLGIPEDLRARLMQPFFTTKQVGTGTGLGLSISKGIVENHGGVLYLDTSCPNTRFVFTIPSPPGATVG